MEKKIRDIRELIERQREVLQRVRACEREQLQEELADMEITLRLLELTQANNNR